MYTPLKFIHFIRMLRIIVFTKHYLLDFCLFNCKKLVLFVQWRSLFSISSSPLVTTLLKS